MEEEKFTPKGHVFPNYRWSLAMAYGSPETVERLALVALEMASPVLITLIFMVITAMRHVWSRTGENPSLRIRWN